MTLVLTGLFTLRPGRVMHAMLFRIDLDPGVETSLAIEKLFLRGASR